MWLPLASLCAESDCSDALSIYFEISATNRTNWRVLIRKATATFEDGPSLTPCNASDATDDTEQHPSCVPCPTSCALHQPLGCKATGVSIVEDDAVSKKNIDR